MNASDSLRQRFLNFADKECVPASPLYARLAHDGWIQWLAVDDVYV